MSVLTAILSPSFLVNNTDLIAFIASVMILIFFDEFFTGKIAFPIADYLKYELTKGIDKVYENRNIKKRSSWARYLKKYLSEAIATVLIILYCYMGYAFLGVYIIQPLLDRWSAIITLVVIAMFLAVNYLVNSPKMRRKFFGFGIYNPEKK